VSPTAFSRRASEEGLLTRLVTIVSLEKTGPTGGEGRRSAVVLIELTTRAGKIEKNFIVVMFIGNVVSMVYEALYKY
jgi:hypothetical protein